MRSLKTQRLSINISYLFVVQLANYIFPILTIPYLTRTLGLKGYGIYASLQLISVYAIAIVDYSFLITGVRKIAGRSAEDNEQIFSDITAARIFLSAIGILVFVFCIQLLPQFQSLSYNFKIEALLAIALLLIGNALTPIWFYQGLQDMRTGAILIFFSRLFGNVLIFIIVRRDSDYIVAFFCQSAAYLLSGIVGILFLCNSISLRLPKLSNVLAEMKEGWHLFSTSILGIFISSAGTLVLGAATNITVAGGYSAIERLVKAVLSLIAPFTQAIFPRISAAFKISSDSGQKEWLKYSGLTTAIAVAATIFMIAIYFLRISTWILGEQYSSFAIVALILSPWILFSVLNNLIGIQLFSNIGEQKYYAACFSICAFIYLILCIYLSKLFGFRGAAASLATAEGILFLMLGFKCLKYWRRV